MSYILNESNERTAFVTTDVLTSGATYTSSVIDLDGFTQVQTEVDSSEDGTLTITFYSDSAGTNAVRTLSVPYTAANGYQFFSAPAFVNYVKYQFTNNGTSTQTDFYYTTKILRTSLSPQIVTLDGFLTPSMTTVASRPTSEFNSDRNRGIIGGQESKRKFGVNTSVAANLETVWSYGSDWVPNEILNQKLRIAAGGNAADTAAGLGARNVIVKFLDENWEEVTETIVTSGASASSDSTANCVRLISAKVDDVGAYHAANTGAIVFELNGSGNIMGNIAADKGTTEQAITTIPAGKTAYITEIFISVGQGNSADVKMFISKEADVLTAPYKSKIELWTIEDFSGAQVFPLDTHLKIDAKTDIYFEAEKITGGGNARVSVDFNYFTVDD